MLPPRQSLTTFNPFNFLGTMVMGEGKKPGLEQLQALGEKNMGAKMRPTFWLVSKKPLPGGGDTAIRQASTRSQPAETRTK